MTSKSWQKMFFRLIVPVFALSLLVAAPQMADAQSSVPDAPAIRQTPNTPGSSSPQTAEFKPGQPGKIQDPSDEVGKILAKPEYRDAGVVRSRNWFSNALNNLSEAISNFLQNLFRVPEAAPNAGMVGDASWLVPLVWIILGVAIIAFLIWALTQFNWGVKSKRSKKVGGLLDEDEPERTADEWLIRADELALQGQHREAVRCLYLACLVRIDEAGVARLIRAETNWEHLRRIEASPKRPADLQFRTPTERFDLIWYGFRTKGQPDVDEFKDYYRNVCRILQLKQAA